MIRRTEEEATATEAMVVTMRLFSQALAAYVMEPDRTWDALAHELQAHCHDAQMMAKVRLRALFEHEHRDLSEEGDPGPV
jgi:hypothetical protein